MGRNVKLALGLGALTTVIGYGLWSHKHFEREGPLIFPAEEETAGRITHQLYLGDFTYSHNTDGQNNLEWDYAVCPLRILQSDIGNQVERQKAVFSGRVP